MGLYTPLNTQAYIITWLFAGRNKLFVYSLFNVKESFDILRNGWNDWHLSHICRLVKWELGYLGE